MAASDWPPAPTYELPIQMDPEAMEKLKAEFSQNWLFWFLQLAELLSAMGAGGGAIQHNLLGGLQGGMADEEYHLTEDQHTTLTLVATQRALGRNTAGTGDPEQITATQILDWIGTTRGAILYRGAAGWALLNPGTAGYALASNGAGADPSYQQVTTDVEAAGYWSPLTNGDTASPELIFAAGDTISVWTPTP